MTIRSKVAARRAYPYVNARVRAMRANLVTDADYRKLQKMTLTEITEFLANHGYREEIDQFSADYSGGDLLERALRQHLARTYRKLERISPDAIQQMLHLYYRKFDIWNLKVLLRKRIRGDETDIDDLLMPTRELDSDALDRIQEAGSLEEALNAIPDTDMQEHLWHTVSDRENLQAIEDALDLYYYTELMEQSEHLPVDTDLFQRFLQLEAALTNIEVILRMKYRGLDDDTIMDRLIPVPRRHQIVDHEELARAEDADAVIELLEDSTLGPYVEDAISSDIGYALQRYKLEQGIEMLHRDQLSVNPVLGFMICTEIEVNNLQLLVRAKEEDLDQEFIDKHLVLGVAQ